MNLRGLFEDFDNIKLISRTGCQESDAKSQEPNAKSQMQEALPEWIRRCLVSVELSENAFRHMPQL